MRRGIIVTGNGYPAENTQADALRGLVDEVRTIRPLTCEDRGAAFAGAAADLGDGDELVVFDLAHLGHDLPAVVGRIVELADRGVGISVPEGLSGGELAAAARVFAAAHRRSQLIQVTEFRARAASRSNATPPKCLFVPADLADADE